jgi:hypothetical protein
VSVGQRRCGERPEQGEEILDCTIVVELSEPVANVADTVSSVGDLASVSKAHNVDHAVILSSPRR